MNATVGNPVLGIATMMPQDQQSKLRAGIGLFELRLPGKSDQDKELWGPFDVNVIEYETPGIGDRSRYRLNWRTQNEAYICYHVDNRGNGVAWMPDDQYWHNRLFLLNDYRAANLYLPSGAIVSGVEVSIEINCLKDALMYRPKVFNIYKDKMRLVSSRATEEEAKDEIDYIKSQNATTSVSRNNTLVLEKRNINLEIREEDANHFVYKPEIVAMQKQYRGMDFGRTQCLEFQQKIKPEVVQAIKDAKSSVNTQQTPDLRESIKQAIMSMTKEERKALLEDAETPARKAGRPKKQKEELVQTEEEIN